LYFLNGTSEDNGISKWSIISKSGRFWHLPIIGEKIYYGIMEFGTTHSPKIIKTLCEQYEIW
jgi:hypothetical protein